METAQHNALPTGETGALLCGLLGGTTVLGRGPGCEDVPLRVGAKHDPHAVNGQEERLPAGGQGLP